MPAALLVEDDDSRALWMLSMMPRIAWDWARNGRMAMRLFGESEAGRRPGYDAVFLDYDLSGPSGGGGEVVARALARARYMGLVVVHSANPAGGPMMARMLAMAGVRSVLAPAYDERSPDLWRQVARRIAERRLPFH